MTIQGVPEQMESEMPTPAEPISTENKPTKQYGLTYRVVEIINNKMTSKNAHDTRHFVGYLAGLTSAACIVTAYAAAEKARKEKSLLNNILAASAFISAVEFGLQLSDFNRLH